uniref:Uncharacterized protein n=1 Tax=Anguilla anguilla TaxID=7936 RepID=A0A0E9V0F8_ANGAN
MFPIFVFMDLIGEQDLIKQRLHEPPCAEEASSRPHADNNPLQASNTRR